MKSSDSRMPERRITLSVVAVNMVIGGLLLRELVANGDRSKAADFHSLDVGLLS